jgi:hypothetical protein
MRDGPIAQQARVIASRRGPNPLTATEALTVVAATGTDPTAAREPIAITPDGAGRWVGHVAFRREDRWQLIASTNGPHQRFGVAQIDVSRRNAQFGDGFVERLVDQDGDTLADSLVISVEVDVLEPSIYQVNARLATTDGQEVTRTPRPPGSRRAPRPSTLSSVARTSMTRAWMGHITWST